jgi:hypothetical protein
MPTLGLADSRAGADPLARLGVPQPASVPASDQDTGGRCAAVAAGGGGRWSPMWQWIRLGGRPVLVAVRQRRAERRSVILRSRSLSATCNALACAMAGSSVPVSGSTIASASRNFSSAA